MNVRRRDERLVYADLRLTHLDEVLRIEKETFATPWSRAAFGREIIEPRSHFGALLRDGSLIGYGGYWHVVDEMHISNIAVDPPFRRRGYGAWLLAAMLREALLTGMTVSTLEVREANTPAQELYKAFGYMYAGRRRGYYEKEGEDALIMWNHDIAATVESLQPGLGEWDEEEPEPPAQ